MNLKLYKIIISIIIILNSICFAFNKISANPLSDQIMYSNSSYKIVKVNKAGLSKLKYYAKQIRETQEEINKIENEKYRMIKGSQQYRNKLNRQIILLERLEILNQKILDLIHNGSITAEEYHSVFK